MDLKTLKTGDLIVRQKGPLSTHYIVWIGWRNGIMTVAENHNLHGVRYTNLEEALAGKPITRFEKFGGSEAERNIVVTEINKLIGKRYDLIVFNCEHFARKIASGKSESRQVRNASNFALLSGLTLMTHKNTSVRNLGIICLIAGIIGHASQ